MDWHMEVIMGYGYRYGSYRKSSSAPKKRDYKAEISRLVKISDLDLPDLKKIERHLSKYYDAKAKAESANKTVRAENDRRQAINENLHKEHGRAQEESDRRYKQNVLDPMHREMARLLKSLEPYKTESFFAAFSSNVRTYWGGQYKGDAAKEIIEKHDDLMRRWPKIEAAKPVIPPPRFLELESLAGLPKSDTVITVAGARVRLFFNDFSLADVRLAINQRLAEVEKQNVRINELKARANRAEKEVRNQAKSSLKKLDNQLKKLGHCPYCAGELNKSNAHLDHIYPVAKGGLSREKNLVFVCMSCNIKKRDKTLLAFVREQNLDFDKVHHGLELLHKEF